MKRSPICGIPISSLRLRLAPVGCFHRLCLRIRAPQALGLMVHLPSRQTHHLPKLKNHMGHYQPDPPNSKTPEIQGKITGRVPEIPNKRMGHDHPGPRPALNRNRENRPPSSPKLHKHPREITGRAPTTPQTQGGMPAGVPTPAKHRGDMATRLQKQGNDQPDPRNPKQTDGTRPPESPITQKKHGNMTTRVPQKSHTPRGNHQPDPRNSRNTDGNDHRDPHRGQTPRGNDRPSSHKSENSGEIIGRIPQTQKEGGT